MTRAPITQQGPVKLKKWQETHMGVVLMCLQGFMAEGKLSHELMEDVMFTHKIKTKKTVRGIWNKYKDKALEGKGFTLHH